MVGIYVLHVAISSKVFTQPIAHFGHWWFHCRDREISSQKKKKLMEECAYICSKEQNRTWYAETLYLNTQLQKHIFH